MYDPAFTSFDKQLLQHLGFKVLEENEGCARKVAEPTLFYMPCCPRWLYHNLLAANWQPEALAKVAILGNSFNSNAGSNMLFMALAGAAAGGGAQMDEDQGEDGPADSSYDAAQDKAVMLSGAGAVNEMFCPDMNVHGVAVSLHTFPPALLRARAMHLF